MYLAVPTGDTDSDQMRAFSLSAILDMVTRDTVIPVTTLDMVIRGAVFAD